VPGKHDRGGKDAEVRKVTGELEALLSRLSANVDTLSAILTRPATPHGPGDERLVTP
jgi:hypothetical protein